jgi:hypothetical protein
MSVVGDNQLMPDAPDCPSIVVNCRNAYTRTNHSWILGRILRDHEASHEVDITKESIRIDIFTLTGNDGRPDIDPKWICSWVVIVVQHILAAIPWILYGDWTTLMVTFCGTIGALATGMLPQWNEEKWASRKIDSDKIVALTRGNGHHHVMLFINEGKFPAWDIEALAGGAGRSRSETRFVCVLLAVWWTLLLITVSGLHANTWFLLGVGGIGMLQNVYLAGASRTAGAFNIHVKRYADCPVIIGYRRSKPLDTPLAELLSSEGQFEPLDKIGGVMGALMALEQRFPKVGSSLVTVFFPGSLTYEPGRFKFQWEKDFWKSAVAGAKEAKADKSAGKEGQ